MKKFNQLVNNIKQSVANDLDDVKHIFQKQGTQLVNKLNRILRKKGFQCYYTIVGTVYFSDGYRMKLKFHPDGDSKGQSWFQITEPLVGTETENLVFKKQSNSQICLKSTYRPQSHRGQVKHIHNSIT